MVNAMSPLPGRDREKMILSSLAAAGKARVNEGRRIGAYIPESQQFLPSR
jgi:hypothetical protein